MSHGKLTYSQKKRSKLDYRREYFKHNPGLFGSIWFCSQCGRPLIGKSNVEVDHIVPLNSVAGRNKRYNLVAICSECNKKKSDNGGIYVVKGGIAKIIEVCMFSVQKVIVVIIAAVVFCIRGIILTLINCIKTPIQNLGNSGRIVVFIIFAFIIIYFINSFI